MGDIGPGGGYVFYVSTTKFTSAGSTCKTKCYYLEAAPADAGSVIWATSVAQCYAEGSDSASQSCQKNSIYSNSQGQAARRTAAKAIGMGRANTTAIIGKGKFAHGGVTKSTYAAGLADDYTSNGLGDWFLPSKDELNQMYLNLHKNGLGGLIGTYWSSSEMSGSNAWVQYFLALAKGSEDKVGKTINYLVRAVRAG